MVLEILKTIHFCICFCEGVIFIRECNEEKGKSDWDGYRLKSLFAGRKFEQLMALKKPNIDGLQPPENTAAVDPNPEFNRVFKGVEHNI